jgi:hypothetical protein
MAKVQGATSTIALIFPMSSAWFEVTKVSLIQAMPKIETTAIIACLEDGRVSPRPRPSPWRRRG